MPDSFDLDSELREQQAIDATDIESIDSRLNEAWNARKKNAMPFSYNDFGQPYEKLKEKLMKEEFLLGSKMAKTKKKERVRRVSNLTLENIYENLRASKQPEDVFGILGSNKKKRLKKTFRFLAQTILPENYEDIEKILAEKCFKLLAKWRHSADKKIELKTYGNVTPKSELILLSETQRYIATPIGSNDIYNLYKGVDEKGNAYYIKAIRSFKNNDLATNEWRNLRKINKGELKDTKVVKNHIPKRAETLELRTFNESKRINIFHALKGYVSLREVMDAFPKGIDARAAGWMWNRLCAAMAVAHENKIVHGAIVPPNFLINPATHNGVLVEWSYSANYPNPTVAFIPQYKDYYPQEIFDKNGFAGTDIYMSAMCMLAILGGNVKTKTIPDSVPKPIAGLIHACILNNGKLRQKDPFLLHKDLKAALQEVYGEPKFIEFKMPQKQLQLETGAKIYLTEKVESSNLVDTGVK